MSTSESNRAFAPSDEVCGDGNDEASDYLIPSVVEEEEGDEVRWSQEDDGKSSSNSDSTTESSRRLTAAIGASSSTHANVPVRCCGRFVDRLKLRRLGNAIADHLTAASLASLAFLKLAAPHIFLLLISMGYVYLGAITFIRLEEPHWKQKKLEHLQTLQQSKERFENRLREMGRDSGTFDNYEGHLAFHKYAQEVYKIHQYGVVTKADIQTQLGGPDATAVDDSAPWTLAVSLFFVVTTLTTIGYGDVAPISVAGRAFCIGFAIIGVPLVLITTADMAKFLSSAVTDLYIRYLKLKDSIFEWIRVRVCKGQPRMEVNDNEQIDSEENSEQMADFLWSQLENVHEVKIGASVIFVIMISYSLLGGLLLPYVESQWQFSDAFYFGFISSMKIGFGDLVPTNNNALWASLLYSLFGLTLSTMCIDVVGSHYLERLHTFGRRMGTADYLHFMKQAKFKKKKREVMQQHYSTLVMLGQMNLNAYKKPAENNAEEPKIEEEIKLPPPPPDQVKVVDITPYTITLTWVTPAHAGKQPKYEIKYNIKHTKALNTVHVDDMTTNWLEIKQLKSFSIYEIIICCVNKYGKSAPIKLVQITEPESAPQSVVASPDTATSIVVRWSPPYKMVHNVQAYAVYYSDEPEAPFESWFKTQTENAETSEVRLALLKEDTKYAVCVCAVYQTGRHSPLSKSVICSTLPSLVLAESSLSGGGENNNASNNTNNNNNNSTQGLTIQNVHFSEAPVTTL